jgi:hypothetical protein
VNTPEVPTYTADTSLGRALTGAGQGLGTAISMIFNHLGSQKQMERNIIF